MADALDIPVNELPRLHLDGDVDRSKPIPISIRIARDGLEPNCFYAARAERFALQEDWAESLDANHDRYLEGQTSEGWKKRRALQSAKALVAGETIPAEEWKGWVCDGEETYEATVEELIERLTDMEADAPSYCFATYEKGFDFDLQDAIESYLNDEHHEDAEAHNLNALLDFYDEWKKSARVTTYFPAKQIVVIDPVRFAAEIEEAKALIAAEVGR